MDDGSNLWLQIYPVLSEWQQPTGLGTKIIWVKFPGSSLPHPDQDWWKHLFLIFSHLVGIDAPYFCLFSLDIIISLPIIILWMAVAVLCRHWGGHLYWYISVLWLLNGVWCSLSDKQGWFYVSLWCFLSSSVPGTEDINIISATCTLCIISGFLFQASSSWTFLHVLQLILIILIIIVIIVIFIHCYLYYHYLFITIMLSTSSLAALSTTAILSLLCCSIIHAGSCHVDIIVTHLAGMAERLGGTCQWC